MMDIQEKLVIDMKESMKSGEKLRLSTIRMIRSGLKNAEIAKGGDLSEDDIMGVLAGEARRRKEAIDEYEKAGRDDLASKERQELVIVQEYMPEQMSEDEIEALIREAINETGADSKKDMGRVMGKVMPQVKGKADGRLVNEITSRLLGG